MTHHAKFLSLLLAAITLLAVAAPSLAKPNQDDVEESKPKSAVKDSGDKKDDSADDATKEGAKKGDEKKADDAPVVTHGTVTIDGKEVAYTATAGKMVIKTDDGTPKASVFYIAYTKDDPKAEAAAKNEKKSEQEKGDIEGEGEEGEGEESADDDEPDDDAPAGPNKRPITFAFNGGPGSSSVWLHLGMLGPQRVKLDSDAGTLPPPHELIPNEYSLLDVTDIVFIDPVSTGFSRPAKGEDRKQFHGYDEDIRSVGQFIHDYTSKYGRWASPKFLLGESYGGIRAAGLSGELQDRYHMYLNGVVLVSGVVDFQTLMAYGNNDVAYALFVPGYAATAWYHKALGDDLQKQSVEEVVAAAEKFASGPYLRALMAGDSLEKDRREEIVARMAELTGLSEDYIEASNLRVPMARFGKELLRKQGKIIGRFDSRYSGLALDEVDSTTDYDPSASAVFGAFTSALNDYLRGTLKVEEDRVYEILTGNVHPWDYSEFTNRFVDASGTLRDAMIQNPYLKVFAACGYYDLATPAFAMKYTRDHLNLVPEVRKNFTTDYYHGGHMMYAHEPSLAKLRKDLVKFYDSALSPVDQEMDEADQR
ncbi:S10 family peptidase [Lacipirellula limnantheis]|uniref:Serine carboxypeptidase n=1 Tax=Lacipirellula limnantheis TaxID=2528024 RepID=A0A517U582_9BACT|nr:peptidase S10 [Lacipirellula limnantheis]QDT75799.1 Serine carboxypeptidase [Lacipirellula limnantheis]